MTRLVLFITAIILAGCNGVYSDGKNLTIREIKYNPLLTVGTINNVVYSDVERMDYLTYSVFKSKYKDGYLYQKFITLLTKSNSNRVKLLIEGDKECGTKLSDVTPEVIDNEKFNRLQYHITCTPKTVIVMDDGHQYHYSW